jgi:hydroxymethylpyrimidine pyrophosphatase-like HAD family hydrolase
VCCHYSPDIHVPGYSWLEISEQRANKGAAALALKELVGADRVVCFSDNTNDLATAPRERARRGCARRRGSRPGSGY